MAHIGKWYTLLGTVLIVGSIAISIQPAIGGPKAIYDNPIEPKKTPKINQGKANYDIYCASCHGKTAGGSDKGPTFISRIYHPGHHGPVFLDRRQSDQQPFGTGPGRHPR